nr:zinc finger MYND domain-containing protein 12 isoform X1 [Aotus nancymaae]
MRSCSALGPSERDTETRGIPRLSGHLVGSSSSRSFSSPGEELTMFDPYRSPYRPSGLGFLGSCFSAFDTWDLWGLGRIIQAEEYLFQAQWTVLKSTDCSNATHSLLHRNLGLLFIAKKNYEEARYHLANDIYFASCAFGTEDIRTSGGYFHLANIFYDLKKLDLADTLYTKVSEIWDAYLNNHYQVLSQAHTQQMDLLGELFENDTGLDEAQEAEAIRILTSILKIRESTADKAPQKTIFVLKILVMLYYLMMNSSKAQEYGMRALNLAEEQQLDVHEQSTIRELLTLISTEDHPIT